MASFRMLAPIVRELGRLWNQGLPASFVRRGTFRPARIPVSDFILYTSEDERPAASADLEHYLWADEAADTLYMCQNLSGVFTWVQVGGGSLSDGDYGDVAVSGGGTVMTVESAAGNFDVGGIIDCGGIDVNASNGMRIFDGTHYWTVTFGSNITADRTLTIFTGNADRSFTLSGNLDVAGDSIINGTAYVVSGTDVSAADGGTGRSSHTAYAVICGGTTPTGAQQSVASVGTAFQLLVSNGAGALPSFQTLTVSDMDSGGTDSTTSASYVDTDMSITMTTHGGNVLVNFAAMFYLATASATQATIAIVLDGTPVVAISPNDGSAFLTKPIAMCALLESLAAGSHTIKVQWKRIAGTATMHLDDQVMTCVEVLPV